MSAAAPVRLREDQIQRYARHVLLPDVGGRGQARLLAAAVVVELRPGCAAEIAALAYLAAAGVGRLILTGDTAGPLGRAEIERGILYGAADRGRPRGQAARERIHALNPDVEVILVHGGAEADAAVARHLADAAGGALRLADELEPPDARRGEPGADLADARRGEPGADLADALARGGAAASRIIVRVARQKAT